MDYYVPGPNQNFPGAALVSDIYYTADCGTNEVIWTLNMKNGDVICLTQWVVTSLMETLVYDSSNAELETENDPRSLLDRINTEADENTVVEIYLPPVTYEGDLELTGQGINLFGSTEGDGQTTFTGTITAARENYEAMDIKEITFAGQGGTGLIASTGINLRECIFTGWDTGVLAQDHG